MTSETTDFADFMEIFSFCRSLCRWFCCCFLCFVFFSACSSQSVIWFRPLFLLLIFVFCFLLFSLAPISYSSSYILSELRPLTKNNAFTFRGWCNHCLASLGRLFTIKTPFVLQQSGFCFSDKLSHRNRFKLFINCDFTDTFVVSTETADFAEFTDLCWKPHQYLQV